MFFIRSPSLSLAIEGRSILVPRARRFFVTWSCKPSCSGVALGTRMKKEKSVVSFTHERNIICSQIQLDDISHEQNMLFAGHVVDCRPIKRKKILHRMIICFVSYILHAMQASVPSLHCLLRHSGFHCPYEKFPPYPLTKTF